MAASDPKRGEPAVSVIVATRNRSSYLRDCLESLARQESAHQFEVVVVDNGSSDDTQAVVEEQARRDPRFRATIEPQPGLSRAKNAGIETARGRLLLFTDDDTIVQPGWIDAYIDLFGSPEREPMVAGGPVVPTPEDLGSWPPWFDQAHLWDLGLLDLGARRPLQFEYLWGGNMAVPAWAFESLGGWDESIGRRGQERGTFEDTDYQDRVRKAGGAVWFCPAAVVHHRLSRTEITPERVVRTAFARGRNEYAQESLDGSLPPGGPAGGAGAGRLGVALARWLWWSARFRTTDGRAALERARRAAWESGWSLDALRSGRERAFLSWAAGRLAFGVRGLALRLTGDPASRPSR